MGSVQGVEAEGAAHVAGLHVLLVGDRPEEQTRLSGLLRGVGVRVTAAASAEEALDSFRRVRPEVVVSDLSASARSNRALARALRTLSPERGDQTPTIVITERAGQAPGVDGVIKVSSEDLEERLFEILARVASQLTRARELAEKLDAKKRAHLKLREKLQAQAERINASRARTEAFAQRLRAGSRAAAERDVTAHTASPVAAPKVSEAAASAAGHEAAANLLLAMLPNEERSRIAPHLEPVRLEARETVYDMGAVMRHAYFPVSSVVSSVRILESGKTVGVASVGRDGLVGLPLALASNRTSAWARVQIAGAALKIEAQQLRRALDECPRLRRLVLRYAYAQMEELSQLVACHRLHRLEGQLSRWLLGASDRLGSRELPLTQEAIAFELGTRRSSVSVAAEALQRAGIIEYSRGCLRIRDRGGLEAAACECYRIVREVYDLVAHGA
jgi:CRP-like cAMP-binding protein/DNA-binding response OmpR family regulator